MLFTADLHGTPRQSPHSHFFPRLDNVTYSHAIKATASIILALFGAFSSPTVSCLRWYDQYCIDLYRDIMMLDLHSFSDQV